MTPRYALSPAARRDLHSIDEYYVREAGAETADRILDAILKAIAHYADWPQTAALRPELAPGIRSAPVASYMLYFRPYPNGNGIRVMRIIHGARDQANAFLRSRERRRLRDRTE